MPRKSLSFLTGFIVNKFIVALIQILYNETMKIKNFLRGKYWLWGLLFGFFTCWLYWPFWNFTSSILSEGSIKDVLLLFFLPLTVIFSQLSSVLGLLILGYILGWFIFWAIIFETIFRFLNKYRNYPSNTFLKIFYLVILVSVIGVSCLILGMSLYYILSRI